MVLDVHRRVDGDEHAGALAAATNLAATHNLQGRLGEAEELEAGLLAVSRRVRGNEHPDTRLAATSSRAATYGGQGQHAEAEVLEARRRANWAGHPATLLATPSTRNLAGGAWGKHAEAAALQELFSQQSGHGEAAAAQRASCLDGGDPIPCTTGLLRRRGQQKQKQMVRGSNSRRGL